MEDLEPIFASAARSPEERLNETLTLRLLRIDDDLRKSLKATNLIESVMARLERHG